MHMTTASATTTQATVASPRIVNGFDLSIIEQAGAALAADPAQAQTTFHARTEWQGQLRSRTEIDSFELGGKRIPRKHRIMSDEPIELLGNNEAPNPQELLLAALNACMMVGFVATASQAGLRIDSLAIESECSLDLRGAFGIDPNVKPGAEKIVYKIRVKGSGTQEQFDAVHREMTTKSPNRFHLAQPIPFEASVFVE
jgi:uncharacterized OsmC-like protein